VLSVLEVIFSRDPVAAQGFGPSQRQITFIVFLCVLWSFRTGAAEPRRFSFPELGPLRHCVRRNFHIRARLCGGWPNFRSGFHIGPYAAPVEAVRRSFEEWSV
jgi:hypothetical protein